MKYHIRSDNDYNRHDVYKGEHFIGCYWQNSPGNWQVEMGNGIGWDMIDSHNEAFELIKDNESCV